MQESTTRYIFASILALVAFIEPTINFLTAIVFVVTLDCLSAYNLNRRIKKKYPNYATGKLESQKALKAIYTIGKVYGVILVIWFIEKNIINDYNGAKAGLFDEETNQKYIDAYNDFLIQRKAIKEQIDLDWNENR